MPLESLLDRSRKLRPDEMQEFLRRQGTSLVGEGLQARDSSLSETPLLTRKLAPVDLTVNEDSSQPEDSISRIRKLFSTVPKREDYKPSLGRNILSNIAGVGTGLKTHDAIKAGQANEAVRDAPYNNAFSDWQSKVAPELKLAEIEGEERKSRFAGFGSLAAMQRAQDASNPELQGQLAESRSRGTEAGKYPYVASQEELKHRNKLEELNTSADRVDKRQGNEHTFQSGMEDQRQQGRKVLQADRIKSAQQMNQDRINGAASRLEKHLGVQVDRNKLTSELNNLRRIKVASDIKKQADINATKLLLQKPEYQDLIVKDAKGSRIGTSAELLNKSKFLGVEIPGSAKLSLEDYNQKLLKYKHDLDQISQGYIDTVKTLGTDEYESGVEDTEEEE